MSSDDQRRKEVIVGFTTLLSLAIFIFAIIWGKNIQLTTQTYPLQILFDISGGIETSDPVMVNGVRKGKVLSVDLNNNRVLIVVSLERDVKIYQDAQARVENLELMGGKKIEISPGISGIIHDLSIPLVGGKARNIEAMIVLVGDVMVKVESTLDKLNTSLDNMGFILNDRDLLSSVKTSIRNTEAASKNLDDFLNEASKTLETIQTTAQKYNRLSDTAENFLYSSEGKIDSTLYQFRELLTKMDAVAVSVDTLLVRLNTGEGTFGKLFTDKTLYESLHQAALSVDSLFTKIEKRKVKIKVDVDFY